jgi:hypothetical protein
VTTNRRGSAVIEFPNDLEIVVTREFGHLANLDNLEDLLRSLLDPKGTVSA